ncbi:MAG: cohesin domain-containing protein [Calditrichota bacterium]
MKRITFYYMVAVIISGLVSCEQLPDQPEFNNPYIPGDISYTPPMVDIVSGPQEDEILNSPMVTFSYEGNYTVVDFSYRLDDQMWSAWTSDQSVTYSALDEGKHTFQLRGRNMTGIEDSMNVSRSFQIDAVQGPALWFSPRSQSVNAGSEFTVTLMAEDMYDMMGVYAPVLFDENAVTLVDYSVWDNSGDYLTKNGGTVISLVDQGTTYGMVTFNLAMVEGSPSGVDGSGKLVTLTFRANSNQSTSIQIGNARVTDSVLNNNILSGDYLMPAQVEVQ